MSTPLYSNGKTPQPGDLIALNVSGIKYPFVVVAIGQPANVPGAGTPPDPSQTLTAVPFVALQQVNVTAADTQLWSDFQPIRAPGASYDNNGRPVVPNLFGGRG